MPAPVAGMHRFSLNQGGTGLIVDTFCGGIGGGSKGLRKGLGRMPHICINHDREAIRWHKVNHRSSRHIMSDVREVDLAAHHVGRA